MCLDCPFCGKSVDTVEFKITRETHGGFECPECKQLLHFSQPFAAFRRTLALALSALLLLLLGVKRMVWLVLGAVALWPFMQLLVNGYCVPRMPIQLKPWKPAKLPALPRIRLEPRDDTPLQLFDKRKK